MHSSSTELVEIYNARVLKHHQLVPDESVWFRSGVIQDAADLFWQGEIPTRRINAHGLILAPGYIDLQVNGGFGLDFTSLPASSFPSGLETVAKGLVQQGVTSFCPTLITTTPANYAQLVPLLAPTGISGGAENLGGHLEGPFIHPLKAGAHDSSHFLQPPITCDLVSRVYGPFLEKTVRMVTLAPELPGMDQVIPWLKGLGIQASLGHSTATVEISQNALKWGAKGLTHLFNAMPSFHHRDPGLVGLLGSPCSTVGSRPFYGMISDGVHVHPNSVRIAYRAHPSGLFLVSDCMAALGLPPGRYSLAGLNVEKTLEHVYLEDSVTLAGGSTSLDRCVQLFRQFTQCSIVEALEAASLRPAQFLEIDNKKGNLNPGCDADFLLLNDELQVQEVWKSGNKINYIN